MRVPEVTIYIEPISSNATLPTKAYEHDACFDLYASCDVVVKPGVATEVPTGLRFLIPEGWEAQIRPRSSLGSKGLQIHPGTIDAYYTGEITVLFFNFTDKPYKIKAGDRIAQVAFRKVPDVELVEAPVVLQDPELRGPRGFGSSGR